MIERIDPPNFQHASTVQVDSNADNMWSAIDEIENWATENGFVRTSEYAPRQILIGGHKHFRAICYRLSAEERAASELAHQQMTQRGDVLRETMPRESTGGK